MVDKVDRRGRCPALLTFCTPRAATHSSPPWELRKAVGFRPFLGVGVDARSTTLASAADCATCAVWRVRSETKPARSGASVPTGRLCGRRPQRPGSHWRPAPSRVRPAGPQ